MDKNIYCGRGTEVPYDDLMLLLNVSFNRLTPDKDMKALLPKLYQENDRPQDQNYVILEDGALAAAVGAYDHTLTVCGHKLACRGIGNVAVHPDYRSKGYMTMTMNVALRDMVSDGIAISALAGRRQRYLYYGYDKSGTVYTYTVSRDNIRHVYGDLNAPYTVKEITDPDDPIIDSIVTLNAKSPLIPSRARKRYLDIANSWNASLFAFVDGERFVGYCISRKSSVSEIQVTDDAEFMNCVRSFFAYLGENYSISLPSHQISYRKALSPFAERATIGNAMSFNILNYRAVIEAFLDLKFSYETLPDGEITLLIHGYAGDERICINVKDGKSTVKYASGTVTPDYELNHTDAISLLFSPISAVRDTSDCIIKAWFPLPLYLSHVDGV